MDLTLKKKEEEVSTQRVGDRGSTSVSGEEEDTRGGKMQPEEFVPWMGSRTEMGPLKASAVTVPTCVGRRVGVPQGQGSPWMPRAEGWGVITSLWS